MEYPEPDIVNDASETTADFAILICGRDWHMLAQACPAALPRLKMMLFKQDSTA